MRKRENTVARKNNPEGARSQILDAALRLFSEKGYEATTMQNIVDLSGMSRGAIYYHFKDKTEIYQSLYESLSRKPFAYFEEIEKDRSLPADQRMENFFLHLISSPEKNVYEGAIRSHKNPNLVEMTLRISVLEASKYLETLIEEGIEEGIYAPVDARMIAELFCISIDMWLNPCINENTPEEELDRKVLEDFLDAETVEQKRRILEERSSEIDERTLLNIELSLDIVAKNGATIDDRIGYVMYYLRTRGIFETTRLR